MLNLICLALSVTIANTLHILPCEPNDPGPYGCDAYMRNGGRLGAGQSLRGNSFVSAGNPVSVVNTGAFGTGSNNGFGNEHLFVGGFSDDIIDGGFNSGVLGSQNLALSEGKSLGLSSGFANSLGASRGLGSNFGLSQGLGTNVGISRGFKGGNLREISLERGSFGPSNIGGFKRSFTSNYPRNIIGGSRGRGRGRGY